MTRPVVLMAGKDKVLRQVAAFMISLHAQTQSDKLREAFEAHINMCLRALPECYRFTEQELAELRGEKSN